jgi:hypothetical protein
MAPFIGPLPLHLAASRGGDASAQSRPADNAQRGRSASPERRDRSRSRSRERYRDSRRNHSPNGYHDDENRASSYDRNRAPPPDRSANREQRMSQLRESSQQDRRVYVGNLPYEVSWQSLKSFMKEGNLTSPA